MKGRPIAAFVAILLAPAVAMAQSEFETWTVKSGDTCSSIAAEFYGDASYFTSIHRANDLGAPPHILKAGTKLKLPIEADARLQNKRGQVQAQAPKADWAAATEGLELYRSWRLNTLEQARAVVGFRDASELMLRENTLIVIYSNATSSKQKRGGRAELASGALRSRLSELSGLTVDTPTATANLAEGSAVIAVDEAATTRVSNHGGKATSLASKSSPSAPVNVDAGFGSRVDQGKPPSKPKPLPPSPTWIAGPREFATLSSTAVHASWEPVNKATEYFVELAADAEGVQIMRAAYVPSSVSKLEVRGLPAGTYYATVSAIDDDGFESIPAKPLELRVATIKVPAGATSNEKPLKFYAGTQLRAPAGFACRAGADGEFGEDFLVTPVNAPRIKGTEYLGHVESVEIECQGPGGTSTETAEVEIPPFTIEGTDDDVVELADGQVRTLSVKFERGWIATSATADGVDTAVMQDSASTSRMRLIASEDFGAEVLTMSTGGVPVLDVAVRRIEAVPPEGTIPAGLGAGLVTFGSPAPVLGQADGTFGLGALLFGFVDVTPWFTMVGSLGATELLGTESTFSFQPGVEARLAMPSDSVRPYLALGTRAWLPLSGGVYGSLEPGVGTTIALGDWGLDLHGFVSIFSKNSSALIAPGVAAGIYRSF